MFQASSSPTHPQHQQLAGAGNGNHQHQNDAVTASPHPQHHTGAPSPAQDQQPVVAPLTAEHLQKQQQQFRPPERGAQYHQHLAGSPSQRAHPYLQQQQHHQQQQHQDQHHHHHQQQQQQQPLGAAHSFATP